MAVAVAVLVMMAGIIRMVVNMQAAGGFVVMFVVVRQMHVELHAGDGRFFAARNVQVIAVELELLQFALKFFGVHAEVEQRGDEHVAGDAAENVEVKRLHGKIILTTDAHRLTQIGKNYRSQKSVFHLWPFVTSVLI